MRVVVFPCGDRSVHVAPVPGYESGLAASRYRRSPSEGIWGAGVGGTRGTMRALPFLTVIGVGFTMRETGAMEQSFKSLILGSADILLYGTEFLVESFMAMLRNRTWLQIG